MRSLYSQRINPYSSLGMNPALTSNVLNPNASQFTQKTVLETPPHVARFAEGGELLDGAFQAGEFLDILARPARSGMAGVH